MEKKIRADVTIFLIVAAIIISSLATGFIINKKVSDLTEVQSAYAKIKNLDDIVAEHYINGIDSEVLADALADGFVEGLGDPYAQYFTKSEYKEYLSKITGKYEGIGLTVSWVENEGLLVTSVSKGSPAETAGVEVGDVIIEVEGESTVTLGYDETLLRMNGEVGTLVSFTVKRNGIKQDFEVLRQAFDQITVNYDTLGYIGYIQITGFNALTPEYFDEAVDALLSQNVEGIILDVRNNGGGTIDAVVDVVDRLIAKGVVATSIRKYDESQGEGSNKTIYQAETTEQVNLPMVVLADGNTASGGELFTAALMDYKKAVFIGQTTYGKGTGQTTYKLADGSYLKLTDFTYYPPSGESYNIVGITPDIKITLTQEQADNIYLLDPIDDPYIIAAFDYFGVDIRGIEDTEGTGTEESDIQSSSASDSDSTSSSGSSSSTSGSSSSSSSSGDNYVD